MIVTLNQDCVIPDDSGRNTRAVIFGRRCKPSRDPITLSAGHHVSRQRSLAVARAERAAYLRLRDDDMRDKYHIRNQY